MSTMSNSLAEPRSKPAPTAGLSHGDVRDFFALLKPRVMSLVVFTALVGMVAAPVRTSIPCVGLRRAPAASPSAPVPRAA